MKRIEDRNSIKEVIAERKRQIEKFGYSDHNDSVYTDFELILAAEGYIEATYLDSERLPTMWPWDSDYWKPSTKRRNLIKAVALILAELDRMEQ